MMDLDFSSNYTDGLFINSSVPSTSFAAAAAAIGAENEFHPCHPSNPDFNCTEKEYLVFQRGPQTLQLYIVLPVTILYVGTFIAGVVGNAIVCIVIIRHSSMHTATNYYLFSLAVSDLIYLLFGLPYDLSVFWYQYPYVMGATFCKLRALISEASTYVSVLTIVAFSMERYLAVCHPLHLYAMSGFKRAVRIIAVLWIVSFLSAIPFGLYSQISYINYPPGNVSDESRIMDSAFCAMLDNPPGFPLWEVSSLVFFAIPMAVMMILYGRMGLQIRFRSKHTSVLGVQQGSMHGESKHAQNRKAIIRMLAAVVITFFVSWAPFHAQRLMFLHARHWQHYEVINVWLFSVAGLFYYFSCTINPILYNVMSNRYRVAFRETLCGRQRSFYQHNGFSRDAQSSVRETMISGTGGYEKTQLARIRSMRQSRYNDRADANNTWAKTSLLADHVEEKPSDSLTTGDHPPSVRRCAGTSIVAASVASDVVVVQNHSNGRPKCYATTAVSATTMTATSTPTPTSIGNGKAKGCSLTTANQSSGNQHASNNNSMDRRPLTDDADGLETCI